MKSEEITCPICLNTRYIDWYRNFAVVGRYNPELDLGYNISGSYKIRVRSSSPGVNTRLVLNIGIL